jgi:arylsulfatase A-like enzyme
VRGHSVGARNGPTRLAAETPTLAAALAAAGYETAAFVSNMLLRRQLGFASGFALYDDRLPRTEVNRRVFERTAEQTSEAALAWLAQPRERPFFLWVHFNDPHGPYTPPPDALRPVAAPPGEAPLPVLRSQHGLRGIPVYQVVGDERLPSQYRARYAGEVRRFDTWLGRLLAALPRERETLIVLTADHGESMGEEGVWFSHGHAVTPDLAHVPLLVRAPGIPPGRIEGLVHHVDVAPTLLELLGLPPLEGSDGIALGPIARAGGALPERTLFVETLGEVGAYQGARFLRQATEPTWGDLRAWRPRRYAWRADGSFAPETSPAPQADGALEQALRAYTGARPPLAFRTEGLSEEDRERLRALGYLEPAP